MEETHGGGTSPVHRVAVIGLGTMGAGVAQALAEHVSVRGYDPVPGALRRAEQQITNDLRLRRLLSKDRAVEPEVMWARMSLSAELGVVADADFVIECGPEKVDVKSDLFRRLDEVVGAHAVFASNTSAIPITRLASHTGRPDRVLGMHFMNPVAMKRTVEVIRAVHTSEETVDTALRLLSVIGKRGVVVGDAPGFVSNRVLMPAVNEAAFLLLEGTAEAATVDQIFRECLGHPMGPLETADLIGLDVVLDSLEVLYEHYRDPKFRPCPLLTKLVYAGHYGRKSGKGFHVYGSGTTSGAAATATGMRRGPPRPHDPPPELLIQRVASARRACNVAEELPPGND
ncbi:MAG: 3-hydroxyacyl-CoA dehydrogenase family protein [Pseudonocardiaceae bacterium]